MKIFLTNNQKNPKNNLIDNFYYIYTGNFNHLQSFKLISFYEITIFDKNIDIQIVTYVMHI